MICHSKNYQREFFPSTRPTGWSQRNMQMPNVLHQQQMIRRQAK